MGLIQVIYVSNTAPGFSAGDVAAILEVSSRNNVRDDITGMLLMSDDCFMQVLEGPEAAVDRMVELLHSDLRHREITLLARTPITERDFSRWSMGFRRVDAREAAGHAGWVELFQGGFNADVAGARPGLALEVLRSFARLNVHGR